jgi:LacI family transcriptional regulator
MAATIKDVALRAGVSIASVSRALNGTGVVTEQTRRRVQRAAKLLRYTPHQAARSLITRRTRTIGVLLPDIHGEYFSELIRGIDRALIVPRARAACTCWSPARTAMRMKQVSPCRP